MALVYILMSFAGLTGVAIARDELAKSRHTGSVRIAANDSNLEHDAA
jgi:hypothetical protein